MKTSYNDIEISYVEGDNCWHFELRGRSRKADSLAKAKEAIDKEPPEKRKQVFPRFDAYMFKWGEGAQIVTVTSLADKDYSGNAQFWITSKKKERSKERACSLFPVNEKNTAIVAEINRIQAEITTLEKAKETQHNKLQQATVPKEIA